MVISNLEFDLLLVLDWFSLNLLAANIGKFKMLILGNKDTPKIEINLGHLKIKSTDSVELLGITIDSNLSFSDHIKSLCAKTKFEYIV